MLDEYNYRYIANNRIINLSHYETYLLELLIHNKGKWTSIEEISDYIYGDYISVKKALVIVCRLRKKMKEEIEIQHRLKFGFRIKKR